jgi:two-component system sensor histidine kinase YesM
MFKKLSFQQRLFIRLSIILVIMMMLLSSAFYTYSAERFLSAEFESSRQIAQTISSRIDELFKQMDIAASNTVNDEELQNIIYELNFNPDIDDADMLSYDTSVRKILQQIFNYIPKATKIAVFNSKKHFFFYAGLYDNSTEKIRRKIYDAKWYENLIPAGKNMDIVYPHVSDWSDAKNIVISLYRKFVNISNIDYAVFEIQLPYSSLEKLCEIDTKANTSQIVIYNSDGRILYPFGEDRYQVDRNGFEPLTVFRETGPAPDGSGRIKGKSGHLLYAYHQSDYTGWKVALISKETVLEKQFGFYRNLTLLFAVTILSAILVTFFILTSRMTKPLKKLIATVEDVNLENLNLPVPHEENDEFRMLNESFENMFKTLKDSINKVYESRIKESNAHFLALQAQMNPHFLFNTLNAISAAGEHYGSSATTRMCNQLADMLRYTTSSASSVVPLKDEITHAVNYLELMKVPYEGSLDYELQIPEEFYGISVPKLTLQPLAENCITHGLESILPPWRIRIAGRTENGRWYLSVEDNGSGIDEAALRKIRSHVQEYRSNLEEGNFQENLAIGGMGLLNIYARLAIHFGTDAVFEIENLQPAGCRVTFGSTLAAIGGR